MDDRLSSNADSAKYAGDGLRGPELDLLPYLFVAFSGSVFAGALGAILGLGGGIFIVPLLTLFLGVDIRYAIAASIVSVIATSSAGAASYLRAGLVNLRLALFLGLATVVGAVSGAFIAGFVARQALYVIFAVVLASSALAMLRKRVQAITKPPANHPWSERLRLAGACPEARQGKLLPYNVANVPGGVALMYLAGIVSGLLGIGAGVLTVPAMDLVMRLPIRVSSATSTYMLGMTGAATAGIYFARGEVVPIVAAPVAMGVLIGALLGAQLMLRISSSLIRRVFVLILLVLAVQMAMKGLGLDIS